VGLASSVVAVPLAKSHGTKPRDAVEVTGKPKWVNRNDVDWKDCDKSQVVAESGMLTVAVEEGLLHHDNFVDHHAFLYRCDVDENPFYLRYTLPTGGTTLLNLQWPSILDETYLFASTSEDKDKIGYGFRILVSSSTEQRAHFKRFFFHSLKDLNRFIAATSTMTNNGPTILHKADFFKAPRYDIDMSDSIASQHNEFGDHYYGLKDADLLKAADQGQPTVPDDNTGEDPGHVAGLSTTV